MSIRESITNYFSLSPLNVIGTAKALSSLRFQGGYGGQSSGWMGDLFSAFNSRINYALEVGEPRNLTLVQAATQWVARGLISAPLKVVELNTEDEENVVDHPLTDLFRRPNPYYSRSVLLRGIALSLIVADEAYILKVRSKYGQRFGAPIELWWEPHWTIRPRWSQSGANFIDYFELRRDGMWNQRVEIDDVIVLRRDLDPDTRRGFGPTSSLLREYYTDQQASGFMAQLLRQGLVPPIVVGLGNKDAPFTGNPEDFKNALIRKMSGDKAGEPMVIPGTVDVNKLGFDYSDIGMDKVRRIPVERFCAVMGISPVSLNLTSSGDKAEAYANVENYLKHDYRSYIVPLHDYIGEEFETQLLPDFGTPDLHIRWDYTRAAEMQPDKTVEANLATSLFEKGVIQLNEARERVDYKPVPEGDKFVGEIGVSLGEQLLSKPGEINPEDLEDDEDDMEKVKPNGKAKHVS